MRLRILIVAEAADGGLPVFLEDLFCAAQKMMALAGGSNGWIRIYVPGKNPLAAARKAAALTGCLTEAVGWPLEMTPESLKQGLARELDQMPEAAFPDYILFAHNTMGRELAPALGARLGACTLSGVTDIRQDGQGLVFCRPVMDNTRLLSLRPAPGKLCLLTLAPGGGRLKAAARTGGRVVERKIPEAWIEPAVQRLAVMAGAAGGGEIQDANIVVAAGRGIGGRENLKKIDDFSARLPNACTGASRPLVDQGWVDYGRQVGITGATVSPDLYIACGISGSSQHLAGMARAKWVVSINKNPDAPICRHSDLCIPADVNEFIDAYLESE
ncbi:MAG: electron transfer flavoprotein subunit alpha/FixB family protein [Desulfobacter sp.]|nr:MAG: electron transfer flavoprotein subunit alpha/FixB family protein [Desulfobacter sp.]